MLHVYFVQDQLTLAFALCSTDGMCTRPSGVRLMRMKAAWTSSPRVYLVTVAANNPSACACHARAAHCTSSFCVSCHTNITAAFCLPGLPSMRLEMQHHSTGSFGLTFDCQPFYLTSDCHLCIIFTHHCPSCFCVACHITNTAALLMRWS